MANDSLRPAPEACFRMLSRSAMAATVDRLAVRWWARAASTSPRRDRSEAICRRWSRSRFPIDPAGTEVTGSGSRPIEVVE